MKNIQVIAGAVHSRHLRGQDEECALIYPPGQDVAFINEVYGRAEAEGRVDKFDVAFKQIWKRRLRKVDALGVHGLLFCELDKKMQYYPTRRDEEAANPDGKTLLRYARAEGVILQGYVGGNPVHYVGSMGLLAPEPCSA